MSVIVVSGITGAGKTLMVTYLMKKKFKLENNLFKRLLRKSNELNNNIFSNYPIKLSKNVYSNKVSKEDFLVYKKWYMDSDIVFDEFQAVFGDSMSYKLFPDVTAKNFQFHRHFGINNIYLISQHPCRIMKIPRDIAAEYWKIKRFINFFGIGFFKYTIYYNFDDFGKSTKKMKDKEIEFDYKNKFRIFLTKPVFKAYDTKYLRVIVENKPYIIKSEYITNTLSINDIRDNFNVVDIEKNPKNDFFEKIE